ncbi:acyl-ACP--UDP-N-acetylglucosamine O-acyltransferase [Roseospira goensis]|uniref:Acyl-[acyl-carrier-protein]--UDP-N-acetylglucosamine O-acyltransferase n=1 Tax=Roseospira goensis TaxID=391922 RepID=A0A7W6RYJ5_9PROT|nr:acyl-ACP--UDP-N-acetylglucosamine O-acyltransferase [Roseospira goensis]MBB4285593.1 UDP-N-acetylglucosamine acyltransferase [Roseospira goensis]
MASIHPSALVDPAATVADDVTIGPYCTVGPDVTLEAGVTLLSHVVVDGRTRIGGRTRVFPFTTLGLPPQDLKYRGERTELRIGADNTIREHVTMNPGTAGGGGLTQVGDGGLFMVGCHVAHDCQIGDGVILANNVLLAGHIQIGDHAILGGGSAVHQFVRVGRHAMVGGVSGVETDVIPFGNVMGNRARLNGLNLVGLKRRGFSREDIQALRSAYRMLFEDNGVIADKAEEVAATFEGIAPVMEVLDFVRGASARGLCRPARAGADLT